MFRGKSPHAANSPANSRRLIRFRVQTLLWVIAGSAVFIGWPLAIVGRFGEVWWRLILTRLFDQIWNVPFIFVAVIAAMLIWKNRSKNPHACRFALLGIGIQLAMFYVNFVYNLWLEAVPRLDSTAWDNMDETLGVVPYLYAGAELISGVAASLLLLRAFLLALQSPAQSEPT